MVKSPSWFYALRSEQLSIVYLTRRDDLRVVQSKHEHGPNLLITLLSDGRDVGRYMGVEAKGVSISAVHPIETLNKYSIEITSLRMDNEAYRELPFPLCLFVFSMEDDRGYWKWIREPVLDTERNRTLVLNTSKTLLPLTNQAVEQMVQTVRDWYEHLK